MHRGLPLHHPGSDPWRSPSPKLCFWEEFAGGAPPKAGLGLTSPLHQFRANLRTGRTPNNLYIVYR